MGMWSNQGSASTLILGADVAPTLKNLSSSANKLGSEFDNSAANQKWQYADFELLCRGAAAFTASTTVKLWLIDSLDATNYEDGGDSVTPARPADAQFYLRAVDTAQRMTVVGLILPPGKFKPLVRNEGGQAFTNTDAENVLRMRPYNEIR